MNIACSTEIREVDGIYYAICNTYNLITENKLLQSAYDELCQRRNEIMHKFQHLKITPKQPNDATRESSNFGFLPFVTKVLIVCTMLFIPMIFLASSIVNTISAKFTDSINFNMLKNPAHISQAIKSTANLLEKITPEKKIEIQNNLKVIVKNVKPITDQLQPLLHSNESVTNSNSIDKQNTGLLPEQE